MRGCLWKTSETMWLPPPKSRMGPQREREEYPLYRVPATRSARAGWREPKMRRSRVASSRSRSPRTQNTTGHYRNVHQARYGNQNAKKALAWLDSYDLSSPEGVDAFLQQVIKCTWTGELGTRAAGALNGSLRILLEHLTLPSLEKRITELERSRVRSQ